MGNIQCGLSKRIGIFGALALQHPDLALPDVIVHPGIITEQIRNRRMFSKGSLTIGDYVIPSARIFWDTGSKQTFVFVPSYDVLGIACSGSFSVSGIGAEVEARAYPARIDLSADLSIDELIVGVMIGSNDAGDDSFESADIILGMDVIKYGRLMIDGPNGRFSFEI